VAGVGNIAINTDRREIMKARDDYAADIRGHGGCLSDAEELELMIEGERFEDELETQNGPLLNCGEWRTAKAETAADHAALAEPNDDPAAAGFSAAKRDNLLAAAYRRSTGK
jgi:hypothetical protein